MTEHLPFWPKAAMIAGNLLVGIDQYLYTRSLSTIGLTQVVLQFTMDLKLSDPAGSGSIRGIPQISNDGVNWKNSSTTFAEVNSATSVPYQETIKLTEIGSFMRIKLKFNNLMGMIDMGATIEITGVGRSKHDTGR